MKSEETKCTVFSTPVRQLKKKRTTNGLYGNFPCHFWSWHERLHVRTFILFGKYYFEVAGTNVLVNEGSVVLGFQIWRTLCGERGGFWFRTRVRVTRNTKERL